MKNVNSFQIAEVQPRVLLSICLIFCQFQPCVAYKSVAYKKCVYLYLLKVLKSLTTVFEGILSNFNAAHKEDNVHYSSLMGILV